jgi:uncharacterized membrane protein YphA (DoxX/SURF4 family)
MKIFLLICRTLLGLGFIIFGLNLIHPFLPQPPPPEGSLSAQFMNLMFPTHWMTLVGIFQFLGGLLVIIGRTAPLGLAILAPILVNILAFHILLAEGQGIAPGLVFSALEIITVYSYRNYFRSLFTVSAVSAG